MNSGSYVIWTVAVVAFAVLAGGAWVSREARLRRRRRKSHTRIVSKTNRPTVRFSVRPPKDKD
jgi:hypothetical protein